jgi:predicted TPR repeat methyltransferase
MCFAVNLGMPAGYEPRTYWEQRLNANFSARGVGHMSFSVTYNEWLYRRKREILESALRGHDLAGRHVLDVGCGTGFFVDAYTEHGAHVHGMDITDVSVARLQAAFPQHVFVTQDIGSSDYQTPRQFDVVNIWDVLYHIVDEARFRVALRNLSSSVERGGLLLLSDQLAGAADVAVAEHVRFRCLATYQALLPDMGMHLVKLLPLYFKLNDTRGGVRQGEDAVARYYEDDTRTNFIARDNLSVGVWQRE